MAIRGTAKEFKIPCTYLQDVTGRRHADEPEDEKDEKNEEEKEDNEGEQEQGDRMYLFCMHDIIGPQTRAVSDLDWKNLSTKKYHDQLSRI